MDEFPIPRWLVSMLMVLLAAAGGMLGYSMREHDKGNPVSIRRTLFEGAASGFVGILVLFLCNELDLSITWTGFIVGVLGWLGATSSIRILERFLPDRFGAKGDTK